MATHPLRRTNTPRTSNTAPPPSSDVPYDSPYQNNNTAATTATGVMSYSNDVRDYSDDDELSGGYPITSNYDDTYEDDDDEDTLNSEAREYYNSGASELVTTVR